MKAGGKVESQAVLEKYAEERAKRIRPEGLDQYSAVVDDRFLEDPFAESEISRDPIQKDVVVAIIGGGFSGMLAAAYLSKADVRDICVIEKASDFGGTWYWNRYPGASCDIESYVYIPMLEDVGFMPTEKYARGTEIFAYCQKFAAKYNLYQSALLSTEVKEVRWSNERRVWRLKTDRGDEITARFVIMANGILQRPKLPAIPGIDRFKGEMFHTSRWNYNYTGGGPAGNLTKLEDKRVGVVGTGATAIQCVPYLGKAAEHLYVFQRTPSSVDIRNNRPTDPAWAASLTSGWQRRRTENFNLIIHGVPQEEDLVDDGWTSVFKKLKVFEPTGKLSEQEAEARGQRLMAANLEKMEEIRARVGSIVRDPRTAEALKPYYYAFCKRPCFHDEYLAAFNLPTVTLVDTDGRGIERINERTVYAGGKEYEVDCLIFATGFEFGNAFTHRVGYEVYGRGGKRLTDKWAKGVVTLHGMQTHDFPNCFIITNVQAGLTPSFTHLAEEQASHIAYIIEHCLDNQIGEVEVSRRAEDEWVQEIRKLAAGRVQFEAQCTPSYNNNEGRVDDLVLQNGPYGGGAVAYLEILRKWREAGDLKGLALSPVLTSAAVTAT